MEKTHFLSLSHRLSLNVCVCVRHVCPQKEGVNWKVVTVFVPYWWSLVGERNNFLHPRKIRVFLFYFYVYINKRLSFERVKWVGIGNTTQSYLTMIIFLFIYGFSFFLGTPLQQNPFDSPNTPITDMSQFFHIFQKHFKQPHH